MSSLLFPLLSFIVLLLIAVSVWLLIMYRKKEQARQFCQDALNVTDSMTWHWFIENDSIAINSNWSKFLGFSIFDLKPFSFRKALELIHPLDVTRVKRTVDDLIHGDSDGLQLDFKIQTKDLGYKWVRLSGRVSKRDKQGHPIELIGVMNDIDEAVLQKQLNEQHHHRDSFLFDLPSLGSKHNAMELLKKASSVLEALTSSQLGFVYLYDEQKRKLQLASCTITEQGVMSEGVSELSAELQHNEFVDNIAEYKKPLLINHLGSYPDIQRRLPDALQLNRMLFVPVFDADKLVMVMAVANAKQDYLPTDLQSAQLIASQTWQTIKQQRSEYKLEMTVQQLDQLAHFDNLTELPNRNLVVDRIQQAIERQKRNRKDLALLLIDLDGFSEINERYGHQAGDALLQVIGQRYSKALRKVDTVGRIGCDEFLVLIESYANSKNIMYIAKRLLEDSNQPCQFQGHEIKVTASVGVFFYHEPEQGLQPEDLISKAEVAMNQSRQRGTHTISVYQPGIE